MRNQRRCRNLTLLLTFMAAALLIPGMARAAHPESFIVECQDDCATVAAAVRQMPGARVDRVFDNVAGLVVSLPREAVPALRSRPGVAGVYDDVRILSTDPSDEQTVPAPEASLALDLPGLPELLRALPAGYDFNAGLTGAPALHAQGRLGSGVVVAVIDSGTANNPEVVPALAGSVLGGETFVPDDLDPVKSATSTHNDPHGTFAGVLIAGHAAFQLPDGSPFLEALRQHAPASVVPCARVGCAEGHSAVTLLGTAPRARLYAMKILPSPEPSAPSSRVLAAMDRAITLRRNFDRGVPSVPTNPGCGAEDNPCVYDSLPIQVVNMSFGGPTLFAGGVLKDRLMAEMLAAGMVPVTAAGSDGPAALTLNSPGTGPGALNVGAAVTAAHERIRLDLRSGPGTGRRLRPSNGTQVAASSSRGPAPDGRLGLDLVAEGYALFGQAADGHLSLVSGSSFSAAMVSGAAALLRERFPAASAAQIRNALAGGADPALLADGSGPIDRGHGMLDLPAAAGLLESGAVSAVIPAGPGGRSVAANLQGLGIQPVVFDDERFTRRIENLLPGQVVQLYVPSGDSLDRLTVSITGVTPALPRHRQNQETGDAVQLTVADAPTSYARLRLSELVTTAGVFTVERLQSGLVRVAVQGAPGNAGPVSCDVTIERQRSMPGTPTATGIIRQDGDEVIHFRVPPGTGEISARLSWLRNWGAWPGNDIDVVLETPSGDLVWDGATFGSPERVEVADPEPGIWTAHVQGYTLSGRNRDTWFLWLQVDGRPVTPLQ